MKQKIRQFFLPDISRNFLLRLALVAIGAYVFFGYLCLPLRIDGISMEPTYHDGGFTFCCRPVYWFSQPERGDVVGVRFAGNRVMLLKRVVGLPGDEVAFVAGKLLINGQPLDEPYVRFQSNWELPPRQVKPNHIYIVGDNRGTSMRHHSFGQVSMNRIVGGVLW